MCERVNSHFFTLFRWEKHPGFFFLTAEIAGALFPRQKANAETQTSEVRGRTERAEAEGSAERGNGKLPALFLRLGATRPGAGAIRLRQSVLGVQGRAMDASRVTCRMMAVSLVRGGDAGSRPSEPSAQITFC